MDPADRQRDEVQKVPGEVGGEQFFLENHTEELSDLAGRVIEEEPFVGHPPMDQLSELVLNLLARVDSGSGPAGENSGPDLGRPLFSGHQTLDTEEPVIMLIESDRSRSAIQVDDIEEKQTVVVKDLGPVFRDRGCFAGGAVMGDGEVNLVLDVNRFANWIQ